LKALTKALQKRAESNSALSPLELNFDVRIAKTGEKKVHVTFFQRTMPVSITYLYCLPISPSVET
jgi:hypothetical protein